MDEWTAMKEREREENKVEQQEEVVISADEGDMLELKPVLNIQKCTFQPHFETQTTSPPRE